MQWGREGGSQGCSITQSRAGAVAPAFELRVIWLNTSLRSRLGFRLGLAGCSGSVCHPHCRAADAMQSQHDTVMVALLPVVLLSAPALG